MKKNRKQRISVSPTKPNKQTLLAAYSYMFRARKIDEKAIVLYKQNKCHFQIGCAGHEAVQVAAAQVLIPGHDWFYPYYRDMAFVCALGMTNREFFLNILNKVDDPNSAGRMMPMHYGHKKLRIVNQSSVTGTQFLQAVGAAKASLYKKKDEIVYVSSGEGTTAQGAYFEAINWAAREKLPIIFLVEDNNFAISVHISESIAGGSVAEVARGFTGLDVVEIDGLDYFASRKAFIMAAKRARIGNGPSLIVAKVIRLQSHSISDNQAKYRYPKDLENERKKDPLVRFEKELLKKKILTKKQLITLQTELLKEIDDDATWAEAQNDPLPETATDNVFVEPNPASLFAESERNEAEEVFMVDALNIALDEEMKRSRNMVVYGQDVAYGKGGVFSVTSGLTKKYSESRVFNAPLAESSIVGTAIGLATVGLKPVVEIQFADYCWTAMMDLRNELAMMSYRSNGTFNCPAVVRIPVGGYIHGGLYHSQNIEATFAHFPGFFIAYPSNAWDAKGMLKAAIRGKDPVLFLEHKGLYRQVYAKGPKGGIDDLVPLGKAKVIRAGSAATIVTWGYLVQKSLVCAEHFFKEYGLEIEVIDLRSIYPLDMGTITESLKKTNRLLIAHEDVLFMGLGAEISAQIAEQCFEYLDAPIMRVGGKYTSIPHSPVLEDAVIPQNEWISDCLAKLLNY